MENPIELKGLWWIPSCQDKKFAGTLRYVRTEETTLELVGEFQKGDWLLDQNVQELKGEVMNIVILKK